MAEPRRDPHRRYRTTPGDGRVVESRVDACPTCRAPWPSVAGHAQAGWEGCHGCSGARHGGHRTHLCLSCGVEHLDAPCDKLGGGRTVQRLGLE